MAENQDQAELRVFRLFAKAARLDIPPESIQKRPPPEPDIQCEVLDHGCTYFELVEIVDPQLARAESNQLTFQQRLSAAAQDRRLANLGNGLVYVSFARATTLAQKNNALNGLMELLHQVPADFRGDVALDGELSALVQRVRIKRGGFVGPLFQVDGATFVTDPAIERIESKFCKNYLTTGRLELLAFYECHPTYRAEFELPAIEECVRERLPSSPFSRVWIFDAQNGVVLYSS